MNILSPRFLALALLSGAALIFPGCNKSPSTHEGGEHLEGGAASLDVRGSVVDSEIYLHQRVQTASGGALEGIGGSGGDIRIASNTGSVQINSDPRSFDVEERRLELNLSGQSSLYAHSGDSVALSEQGYVVDFIRVDEGGDLVLVDGTYIKVNGDVLIAGTIRTSHDSGSSKRDGHDLTILASGTVMITGSIVVSGADGKREAAGHASAAEDEGNPPEIAGNGGEVFIDGGGDMIFTGEIAADGGSSDSYDADRAVAGKGGRIFLISGDDFLSSGRISARAGNSYINDAVTDSKGGSIEIVATGDVVMQDVTTMNLSGGRNSGLAGGAGGNLIIEAPVGDTMLHAFEIDVSGGGVSYLPDAKAGVGGKAALSGRSIEMMSLDVFADGGDVSGPDGDGGNGGMVTLSGSEVIDIDSGVRFDVSGGDGQGKGKAGGKGGNFMSILTDSKPNIIFGGRLDVSAGNGFGGVAGEPGTYCMSTASANLDVANVIGSNPYPLPGCASDFTDFQALVHELGCPDHGLIPSTYTTELPAGTGVDFYKVLVPAGATQITISTSGPTTGNIDLFVGNENNFKDPLATHYAHSSRNPDSSESVIVDINPGNPPQYLSVLVAEQNAFVEEYTITISCSS